MVAQPAMTSDTVTKTNPFADKNVKAALGHQTFIARRIIVAWNRSFGAELQLRTQDPKDNRYIILKQEMPLYKMLVERDPRIGHLLDNFTANMRPEPFRDLYPRLELQVKRGSDGRSTILVSQDAKDLPLSIPERGLQKFQAQHDKLDTLRGELGMGRAECDGIIRMFQPQHEDWLPYAENEMLYRHAMSHQPKVEDKPVSDAPVAPDPLLAAARGTIPAESGAIDSDFDITPPGHLPPKPAHWTDDPANIRKFWPKVNDEFKKYRLTAQMSKKEQEAIVHDVIPSLHETALSLDKAVEAVAVYLKITYGKDKQPVTEQAEQVAETPVLWFNDETKRRVILDKLIPVAAECNIKPGDMERAALDELEADTWADVDPALTGQEAYVDIADGWRAHKNAREFFAGDKPQGPTNAPDLPPATPKSDQPVPTTTLTVIERADAPTSDLILFDPNRAIERAKGIKALIDRLMLDKVLVESIDYGPIPGTSKPVLLKPGAEKLLSAFQLYDKFTEVKVERDWKTGFFFYEYECTLYDRETGKAIGSGIGSCNSQEKKYRYRWVTKDRVPAGTDLSTLPSKGGKASEFDFAVEKAETTGTYGKPAEYWRQFADAIANGTANYITRKDKKGVERKAIEIDTTMYGVPNEEIFDLVNTISKMAQKRALVAAALNATGASAVFTQDMEDFTDFGMIAA